MQARIDREERRRMIAEAAYFRAERRGFTGGDPVADWIEAEAEVDATLNGHDELLTRFESRVAEADEKVEALRQKAGALGAEARAELEQHMDRLAQLRDALVTRSNEIREQGADASRALLEHAESLWSELTEFLARKVATPRRSRSARRK